MSTSSLRNSWVPYTGLRLLRRLYVGEKNPVIYSFLTMSLCEAGDLSSERISQTSREADIEWDKTVCFMDKTRVTDNDLSKKMRTWSGYSNLRNMTVDELPKLPHSRNVMAKPPQILQNHSRRSIVRDKFQEFLHKLSSTPFVEYTQDSLVTKLEDLNTTSYSNVTE